MGHLIETGRTVGGFDPVEGLQDPLESFKRPIGETVMRALGSVAPSVVEGMAWMAFGSDGRRGLRQELKRSGVELEAGQTGLGFMLSDASLGLPRPELPTTEQLDATVAAARRANPFIGEGSMVKDVTERETDYTSVFDNINPPVTQLVKGIAWMALDSDVRRGLRKELKRSGAKLGVGQTGIGFMLSQESLGLQKPELPTTEQLDATVAAARRANPFIGKGSKVKVDGSGPIERQTSDSVLGAPIVPLGSENVDKANGHELAGYPAGDVETSEPYIEPTCRQDDCAFFSSRIDQVEIPKVGILRETLTSECIDTQSVLLPSAESDDLCPLAERVGALINRLSPVTETINTENL